MVGSACQILRKISDASLSSNPYLPIHWHLEFTGAVAEYEI